MRLLSSAVLLPLVFAVSTVQAADHLAAGDRLTLTDPPGHVERRAVRFRATRDFALNPLLAPDPRVLGATLRIVGENTGDGSTGPLPLAAGLWTGLGRPAGSRGYKYVDPNAGTGVRKVFFRAASSGGSIFVSGGKSMWPYIITQPQLGPIDVRLTIGSEVYCAQFPSATFTTNVVGKLLARNASPPSSCAVAMCGNGVAESVEECDDGGVVNGDGCTPTCQLESVNPALCAGVPTVAGTGLDSVRVAAGLTKPLFVTAPRLDPNRIFIVEQGGLIKIVKNGVLLTTPFLNISNEVSMGGEQGLLSLAFHPDYEANGRLFVSYTAPGDGPTGCNPPPLGRGAGDSVIAEYHVKAGNPDQVDEATKTVLLTIDRPFANHNGGHIAFGPDGMLYFANGDGGSANDPCEAAQNDGEPLGKILRFDVDAPPANPLDAVWAKGLRNPWRFSFDRLTGDLYVADVGQGLYEEVNFVAAPAPSGVNYGWDVLEGRQCREPKPPFADCASVPVPFGTWPVIQYCHFQMADPVCGTHPRGISVTGGYAYRGCRLPDLAGTYFYSDIDTAFIASFNGVIGGDAQNLLDRTADVAPGGGMAINGVSSFGEDARGEIYIVDYQIGDPATGEVYKIIPGS